MGLYLKGHFNHTMILLIFIFFSTPIHSQDKLNYGTTNIASKQLEIDKYDCKITPSFSLNEENPENLKLNFDISWIDKKGNLVQQPDKIALFIKVNNNIEEYCSSNGKKLSTSPGLFGKKNIELTNSLSFTPPGIFEFIPYRSIHFTDNMAPVLLKILNHSTSPISINLVVYIGKEKGNTVEIAEKGKGLNWTIALPELKSNNEEISCEELESKYKQRFEENKPQFLLGSYKAKFAELQSNPDTPIANFYKLNNDLLLYKMNVNSLISLRESIKNNPNYNECNKLPELIGSINSFTVGASEIQNLINQVNIAIQNNAGGSGGGGSELLYEAFDANNIFCENTFNHLYNIKMDRDLLNAYEPNYLNDLYVKLNKLKVSQDSLYNIIISSDESPAYKRAYKNFKINQSESIAIIEAINPDVTKTGQAEIGETSPLISTKGRSFPYTWIIIPLIAIIAVFGGFKLFKYFKKAKSLDDKTK